MFDAHGHWGFAPNGVAVARRALEAGQGVFSCTVEPTAYAVDRDAFSACSNVRVGLGLHPWFVEAGSAGASQIDAFRAQAAGVRFIGEVGLDFGRAHVDSADAQLAAFSAVMEAVARGFHVVSIHAVRAATPVLDVLERTGALDSCACIFHWFSGTSQELVRARRAGCYFSVGARMLATRRGRAYASQMPLERLLVETDLPSTAGERLEYDSYAQELTDTYEQLARLRGPEARVAIDRTAQVLFGA